MMVLENLYFFSEALHPWAGSRRSLLTFLKPLSGGRGQRLYSLGQEIQGSLASSIILTQRFIDHWLLEDVELVFLTISWFCKVGWSLGMRKLLFSASCRKRVCSVF